MCSVDGCGRDIVYVRFGLCAGHREQQRSGLPFSELKRRVIPEGPCSFGPCAKLAKNLGLCHTHYLQQYHGRPMRMITKGYVPTWARDEDENKWCSTCETWRPETDFARSSGKFDGLQPRCRPCNAAIYASRSDDVRDYMRQQRLNMSRAQFDAMLASQGNACAICGATEPGTSHWHVDHDHRCCPQPGRSCGECIRGILCRLCNQGLGQMRDNPAILEAAATYLRVQGTRHSRAAVTRGAR